MLSIDGSSTIRRRPTIFALKGRKHHFAICKISLASGEYHICEADISLQYQPCKHLFTGIAKG